MDLQEYISRSIYILTLDGPAEITTSDVKYMEECFYCAVAVEQCAINLVMDWNYA